MGHCQPQGICDADEAQHGEVAVTQFNLADVRGTETCPGGEGFVGEPLVLPILANGRSKQGKQCSQVA